MRQEKPGLRVRTSHQDLRSLTRGGGRGGVCGERRCAESAAHGSGAQHVTLPAARRPLLQKRIPGSL